MATDKADEFLEKIKKKMSPEVRGGFERLTHAKPSPHLDRRNMEKRRSRKEAPRILELSFPRKTPPVGDVSSVSKITLY